MGASDSCLETSICPPAFIPDHSYEIKFNKNLFLRHQRNEIQPFLNNWTQWDRTAEDTSCSTCISQVRHLLPLRELGNKALYFFLIIAHGAWPGRRAAARLRSAPGPQHCSAFSIWKPVCSFVGNRKSFFLDAFPGFCGERRPRRLSASSTRPGLDEDAIRIFNQFQTSAEIRPLYLSRFYPIFFIWVWAAGFSTASPVDSTANR